MRMFRRLAIPALLALAPARLQGQGPGELSVQDVIAFLTLSGHSRYETGTAKARILASEVGGAASEALTQLLSQPPRNDAWVLLGRALEAASYNPIVVPESVLLRYVSLGAGPLSGLEGAVAGDLRLKALVALSYRPRPQMVDFWERLWDTEQSPLIRQIVLGALACTAPDRLGSKIQVAYASRLLTEVAARISEELVRGEDARVCHGGESTRAEAWSFRPELAPDLREAGREMLKQAGIFR